MKTTKRSLSSYDPDFLTLRIGKEVDFEAEDMNLGFGQSTYTVMTVVHWDSITRRTSVSSKRNDG